MRSSSHSSHTHIRLACHPVLPGIPFDTANVMLFCGGTFVGLEQIVGKRLGVVGFEFGQMAENNQVISDGLLRLVLPEDLEQFGLIPGSAGFP